MSYNKDCGAVQYTPIQKFRRKFPKNDSLTKKSQKIHYFHLEDYPVSYGINFYPYVSIEIHFDVYYSLKLNFMSHKWHTSKFGMKMS